MKRTVLSFTVVETLAVFYERSGGRVKIVNQMPQLTLMLILSLGAWGCAKQSEQSKPPSDLDVKNLPTSEPVKVLVQERYTGLLAIDGLAFLTTYMATEIKDEVKRTTTLDSGNGLVVEPEVQMEIKTPADKKPRSPEPWKKDPKGFDFVLEWNKEWTEHEKKAFSEPFQATVNETLKLVKVSDPKVMKSWSYAYDIKNPGLTGDAKTLDEIILDQIRAVVSPVRAPVLKEIRAFINSNVTK